MEARVTLLTLQVIDLMIDLTSIQSELAGSVAKFEGLMVMLVTHDGRIKKIVEVSD